ncbi:hypothetical protein [Ferruginibacter sp.]
MHALLHTVNDLFTQTNRALQLITAEQYSFKNALLGNATIGQHVRHIIELFQEMMTGYSSGNINYENRRRDFLIETDKTFAGEQMQVLLKELNRPDKKLLLSTGYSTEDDECITTVTNFYREFIYNIEHTVHHLALIKIGYKSAFNIDLPDEFGVAASTLKYRKLCVQ